MTFTENKKQGSNDSRLAEEVPVDYQQTCDEAECTAQQIFAPPEWGFAGGLCFEHFRAKYGQPGVTKWLKHLTRLAGKPGKLSNIDIANAEIFGCPNRPLRFPSNTEFNEVILDGTKFQHVELLKAVFRATLNRSGDEVRPEPLQNIEFHLCNLNGATFEADEFRNLTFNHCSLLGTRWIDSSERLARIFADKCHFIDVDFSGSVFRNAKFADVELSGVKFGNTHFDTFIVSGGTWRNVDLSSAKITADQWKVTANDSPLNIAEGCVLPASIRDRYLSYCRNALIVESSEVSWVETRDTRIEFRPDPDPAPATANDNCNLLIKECRNLLDQIVPSPIPAPHSRIWRVVETLAASSSCSLLSLAVMSSLGLDSRKNELGFLVFVLFFAAFSLLPRSGKSNCSACH